jgi:hypothetical protein
MSVMIGKSPDAMISGQSYAGDMTGAQWLAIGGNAGFLFRNGGKLPPRTIA